MRYHRLGSSDLEVSVVGASRPEQVRENAPAVDVTLDAESLAEIDAILAE